MGDRPVSLDEARRARGGDAEFEARAEGFLVRARVQVGAAWVTVLVEPEVARRIGRVLDRAGQSAQANRRRTGRQQKKRS